MAELGNAYVNIIPKAPGIEGELKKLLGDGASGAGGPAGQKAGNSLISGLKKAVTAAAVGKIIKDAFSAGGDLQQSFGGLDTIYGDAAAAAKKYAQEAALVGISANDYAESAVSFGASLKAAFAGDTTAAMEAANTAIMDMTDNAAKMGTPIESIQQAYQGFAKQNYTMLDNLKLGYGGTKTEMERLLSDAQKLTGVKYDISNLGDVYEAIHVIQGELGLTGVAAQEAETTLTGSMGAVQASWTNVMAAMTTGESLDVAMSNLSTSVGNFANVVLQMFGNLVPQIPTFIAGIAQAVIAAAPTLLPGGVEMVGQLLEGIVNGFFNLLAAIPGLVSQAGDAFLNYEWSGIGGEIIGGIVGGLLSGAGQLLSAIADLARNALQAMKAALGINSPSKLFRDEVGRWIPEGMAVGIEANLVPVKSSVKQMAASASAELQRATAPGVSLSARQSAVPVLGTDARVENRVTIEFTGSLAQLGRVLQPHIKSETSRRGEALVSG